MVHQKHSALFVVKVFELIMVESLKLKFLGKKCLIKAQKGQRTFAKSAKEDSLVMSEASSSLSMEEQLLRAETIQALKCVNSNLSFASANGDGDRFRTMFPDSKTAEKYSQNKTKINQYGPVWSQFVFSRLCLK